MLILMGGFVALLLLSCGYAIIAGGRDARLACAMMLAASLLTPAVTLATTAKWPLMTVDTMLLFGLVTVALYSRRYWPLWTAGLHSVAVAGHIAVQYAPDIAFRIYHAIIGFWSIPVLLVMPLGIFLDRRRYTRERAGPA